MLDNNLAEIVNKCLEYGTVRLIGVNYKKKWSYFIDPSTKNIIIDYD